MVEKIDKNVDETTDPSLIHYNKGFKAGQKSFVNKFKDDRCVDQYEEGYKAGFKDGYKSAVTDVKEAMVNKQDGTGVDPGFGIKWWP